MPYRKEIRKENTAWRQMIYRCYRESDANYCNYGGKGVTVDELWRNDFYRFLNDMGKAPTKLHSLDRIDRSKPYGPNNCRWALPNQQTWNRSISRIITAYGESKCVGEWAHDKRCAIKYMTLIKRIQNGWDPEMAISSPNGFSRRSKEWKLKQLEMARQAKKK